MAADFTSISDRIPEPFRLLIRDHAESTNDVARDLALAGAADGLIVLAKHQSAGRGRRGAPWFSTPGESLAFSIILRPDEPKALWPRLALAAGLSVAKAVESFGTISAIKWPNDVWIVRKKVAGILVEAGTDFAIVGIGINVLTTHFPTGISEIATSLKIETGSEIPLPEVLAAIIQEFAMHRHQISGTFAELLSAVRLRCALTGHLVSLITASGNRNGIVDGIGPSGELLFTSNSGQERLIQADEIRIIDG